MVYHTAQGLDHFVGCFVLEGVSSDGQARGACFERTGCHIEDILVAVHFRSACDDDGDGTALDNFGEGFRAARVRDFDNVCTEFGADPGGVFDILDVELVLDLGSACVHHGDKRHLPLKTSLADEAELGEHFFVGFSAEVDVDGNGVGAKPDGFLDGADELFCIWVGAEGGSAGEVYDQADVSSGAPMSCAYDSLVHKDGVGTAGDDFADGIPHVGQTFDGPDGYAVVHGDDDALVGIAVYYSFESYLFSNHFRISGSDLRLPDAFNICLGRSSFVKPNESHEKSKKKRGQIGQFKFAASWIGD